MNQKITQAAGWLARARRSLALTGAGISIESGIPAFRGSQGLWERYDPVEYAHIDSFRRDPGKVWEMLAELDKLVDAARPNPAHHALADLEAMGRLSLLVTQNVDGLHQAAGHRRVVEFHGSGQRLVCLQCGRITPRPPGRPEEMPPRCDCGGVLKPDVVFFGEPIPEKAVRSALAMASICQVMLVVGTSALVAPAAHLPILAKEAGAKVIEINPEPTPLSGSISDVLISAEASRALPQLVEETQAILRG